MHHGSFLGVKRPGCDHPFHLMPKLKMSGAIPLLPLPARHGVFRGDLYLFSWGNETTVRWAHRNPWCVSVSVWECVSVCEWVSVWVWVCVCERECVSVSVWVSVSVCVGVCVCECVLECVCECVCWSVCVSVCECVCVWMRVCEWVCECAWVCVCVNKLTYFDEACYKRNAITYQFITLPRCW